MSVEPNRDWYGTAHHELGHIYYYLSYSRPEVPDGAAAGANRAYHEGIGSMIGLAALQRRFLAGRGLVPSKAQVDSMAQLLQEALNVRGLHSVRRGNHDAVRARALRRAPARPISFNASMVGARAAVSGDRSSLDRGTSAGPTGSPRPTSTTIRRSTTTTRSPTRCSFQLHDHIAREILHQDPHDTDYYGHREVGDFLRA